MTKAINVNLEHLVVQSFRDPDNDALYERLESAENALKDFYIGFYEMLSTGSIDGFYTESAPFILWTRSTRPGVNVQETHFFKSMSGEMIPSYHRDIRTHGDLFQDGTRDNVTLTTFNL